MQIQPWLQSRFARQKSACSCHSGAVMGKSKWHSRMTRDQVWKNIDSQFLISISLEKKSSYFSRGRSKIRFLHLHCWRRRWRGTPFNFANRLINLKEYLEYFIFKLDNISFCCNKRSYVANLLQILKVISTSFPSMSKKLFFFLVCETRLIRVMSNSVCAGTSEHVPHPFCIYNNIAISTLYFINLQ